MTFLCTTCQILFDDVLRTQFSECKRTSVFVYPFCPVCACSDAVFLESE